LIGAPSRTQDGGQNSCVSLQLADPEEFWSDLIPLVVARQVVPIVGGDLLTVTDDGKPVRFYHRVAERLLVRYGVEIAAGDTTLRPYHELNDAICALDRLGKRASADSYLPAYEAIRTTLAACRAEVEAPLRQLAAIEDFRVFVTTTCDDALAQALDQVRYGGRARTEQVEYAPSGLPKDRTTDLSELDVPDRSAVLYLFGKAAVSPVFAAHDEDVLEFLYGLQAGLGQMPKRFFSAIRGANLLLIGCHFPDWLSRFLLRVTASQRLSEQRGRRDFVIDVSRDEPGFVVFLTTFARNTRISSMSPAEFVAELLERWQAQRARESPAIEGQANAVPSRARRSAVFISYSRSDIGPVRTLYEEIRRVAGDDVAWFDKSAINPGEEWRARILDAVETCQLFLPIVSLSEEARTEGVFIEEWRRALDRARGIDGRAFIVPVFVDADAEANLSRYSRANRLFGAIDFGFAPDGKLTPKLEAMIVRELRALRG
jgi:TIR domain-containing protein